MSHLSPCAALVRGCDRRRYLASLSAPVPVCEAWLSLFAFQHEVAHIAHIMGNEMVGFIRYAWWRETVGALCAGKPPHGHPVAEALALSVQRFALPQAELLALVEAYEKAMAEGRATEESLLEATYGRIMGLCAQVAGIPSERTHIQLGIAWGAMEEAIASRADKAEAHKFTALSRTLLSSLVLEPVFLPFIRTMEFCLARMKKGKTPESAVLLPLRLLCLPQAKQ